MSSANDDSDLLGHESLNEDGQQTIVFLHGLGSSLKEWHFVTARPQLAPYHILLVDLPGHGLSRKHASTAPARTSDLLAKLVIAKAHGGVCHLVGLSAGGFTAVHFAYARPELVQTVFITGVYDYEARWGVLIKLNPYLESFFGLFPRSMIRFAEEKLFGDARIYPPGLEEDAKQNRKHGIPNNAAFGLDGFGEGLPLPQRTLAVAGAKTDSTKHVATLGKMLRQGNAESTAVQIKDAIHCWNLQGPKFAELFAESVRAWIECTPLPNKLEPLI